MRQSVAAAAVARGEGRFLPDAPGEAEVRRRRGVVPQGEASLEEVPEAEASRGEDQAEGAQQAVHLP